MQRRRFDIYEPFREIKQEDSFKKFESGLLTECGSTLASMYEENKDEQHVWVYDADEILGVIVFSDYETRFHIDIVSNNFSISSNILSETKPGSSLYQTVEDIAKKNGVTKITLDSVPNRIPYWKDQFEFQRSGIPFAGDFCELTPMTKEL